MNKHTKVKTGMLSTADLWSHSQLPSISYPLN